MSSYKNLPINIPVFRHVNRGLQYAENERSIRENDTPKDIYCDIDETVPSDAKIEGKIGGGYVIKCSDGTEIPVFIRSGPLIIPVINQEEHFTCIDGVYEPKNYVILADNCYYLPPANNSFSMGLCVGERRINYFSKNQN